MNWTAHLAYPYIIANSIAWLLGTSLTVEQNILLFIFSFLPDLDYAVNYIYTKLTNRRFYAGVNHHRWATHWPITYVPLALLFIFIPNIYTALMLFGIMSHLIMDTIACAWGIMWLYPFSTRWFNYFAAKTSKTKDGLKWLALWKTTPFYKIEFGAFALVLVHLFLF